MLSIENLIPATDFLYLIIYAILFSFLLKYVIFKNLASDQKKILLIFYYTKVFFIVLHSVMLLYVWKLADSVAVYVEAENLAKLIDNDFSNIRFLFGPSASYTNFISLDNSLSLQTGSGMETNFFLTRVATLLYPFALGKYLLISFGYCAISTIGVFKLYLVLNKIYPNFKRAIGLSLLFLPTLLFYSSPIYKETLCLAFLGFAASSCYNIIQKERIIINAFYLAICIFFILLIKPYIIYAIVVAIAIAFFLTFLYRVYHKSIIGKFFTLLITGSLIYLVGNNMSIFDPYIAEFADTSNLFQQAYNDGSSTASFEMGEIQTTFWGVVSKSPLGLYTTYFRPHLWEAKNIVVLFSAFEAFITLLFFLYTLIKKGGHLKELLKEKFITRVILLYIIVLGVLIGLTTFNFGTLARYKVPAIPFLWLFIFLLAGHKTKSANKA